MKCSNFFASKVIRSCESGKYNNNFHSQQDRAIGVGSLCMSLVDILTLFELRYENPYRSNKSCIKNLKHRTGTTISSATVTRFWKENKRMLRKGSVVPMGKFNFNNRRYYAFYTRIVNNIDPVRLVFTDEKLLKGYEIYNKKGRSDENGMLPPLPVLPDYRNTYCIMGLLHCNTTKTAPALCFSVGEENHDSFCFRSFITHAIVMGVLVGGDILVLENAAIHISGENNDIREYLWDRFRILVLTLPTYSPELNPIELIWNVMIQRMQSFTLGTEISEGYTVKELAVYVMKNIITMEDSRKSYKKCGYIF